MGDWARLLIFPFLGVKVPKKAINSAGLHSEGQKIGIAMDIEPNFLKMNYKLLTFAQKSVKKCHF